MNRALILLIVPTITLAGCDQIGLSGGAPTTDTNMRSVDIQAGTASDEMIILDQASGDGTAIDTSVAAGPAAPRPAGADDDDDADDDDAAPADTANTGTATGGDQVIRPPAGGAEPDGPPEPAKK